MGFCLHAGTKPSATGALQIAFIQMLEITSTICCTLMFWCKINMGLGSGGKSSTCARFAGTKGIKAYLGFFPNTKDFGVE